MAERLQWHSREEAYARYCEGKRRTKQEPMSYKDFCSAFDMGWKAGRKLERRSNFNYLAKTKYAQKKPAVSEYV